MPDLSSLSRRAVLALLLATTAAAAQDAPIERWLDLTPPGWNPYAKMNPLLFGRLQDGTPEAVEAMQKIREALDAAPTVAELAGRQARLPGFVVPLQSTSDGVSEFLLVPYFGACIHTPPPPANQIVFVHLKTPQKGLKTMDAVRVIGRLSLVRQGNAAGESGYRIDDAALQRLR
ncbi:DUF3299 domain-containing protein [Pelomonas sp. HMWF004]|nr:DUF3299 domain-containing protein [Pelomonas sp. HMWF004]